MNFFKKWGATIVFAFFVLTQSFTLYQTVQLSNDVQKQADDIEKNNTQSCANRAEARHVIRETIFLFTGFDKDSNDPAQVANAVKIEEFVNENYPEIPCP